MTVEYDEKGKYYTDVIAKVPVPVTMQTTHHLVKGFVHVRHGERIKDELDRDELFLAVTHASLLDSNSHVLFEAPFLAVRRAQIVWLMPDEGAVQKDHAT
jgi:hypothetical protein